MFIVNSEFNRDLFKSRGGFHVGLLLGQSHPDRQIQSTNNLQMN